MIASIWSIPGGEHLAPQVAELGMFEPKVAGSQTLPGADTGQLVDLHRRGIDQRWPGVDQHWPDIGHMWRPTVGQPRPELGGPLAQTRSEQKNEGKVRLGGVGRSLPGSGQLGAMPAEFETRCSPIFDRFRPTLERFRPTPTFGLPRLSLRVSGRAWPDFGQS